MSCSTQASARSCSLLLLLLALAFGCTPTSSTASGGAAGAAAGSAGSSGGAAPGLPAAAGEPGGSAAGAASGDQQGPPCSSDRQCPGYQRCLEGHCAEPPAVHGDGPAHGPTVVFEPGPSSEVAFRVELAVEPFEQMRGLMFRPAMDERWGMIFLYSEDRNHSFWMRNTYIPLDMVFLGADGTVTCVMEHVEPLTLEGRSCGRPSRHVLELVAGAASRHGIGRGTPYRLVDFPPLPVLQAGGGSGAGPADGG